MCGRQYFNAIAAVTAFATGLNIVRCTLGQLGSNFLILSEDLYIATHMNYGGEALYERRIDRRFEVKNRFGCNETRG